MTVTVTKPAVNIREELNSLRKPTGITGSQLLAAETVSDVYKVIGGDGFKNLIQNGDFKIAQRGTSISYTGGAANVDGANTLDRWQIGHYYNGGSFAPAFTISQQVDHPLGNGACMQINTDTAANPGAAVLNQLGILQVFEANQIFHIAGPVAPPTTLSFWVKSNKPGVYGVQIRLRTGGNNPIIMKRYQILQSGVWEYKTITFPAQALATLSNSGNGNGGYMCFTLSGAWNKNADAGIGAAEDAWHRYSSNATCFVDQTNLVQTAGNYLRLADVQWEVGSVATPFERRPIQTELNMCQRYYQKSYIQATAPGTAINAGYHVISTGGISSNYYATGLRWKVSMRDTPTVTIYSPLGSSGTFYNTDTGGAVTLSSITDVSSEGIGFLYSSSTVSNSGQRYAFHYTATAELSY